MKVLSFILSFICLSMVGSAPVNADTAAETNPVTVATSTVVSTATVSESSAASDANRKLATREDAKRLFDDTMNYFVTDRVAEAFTKLKPNFPLEASELKDIEKDIVQKRAIMKDRFGKSIGFVYLGQDALSDVFSRFIYVEKFDRHAIRWLFVVYKPRETWIVNAVSFDDKLSEHFNPVN